MAGRVPAIHEPPLFDYRPDVTVGVVPTVDQPTLRGCFFGVMAGLVPAIHESVAARAAMPHDPNMGEAWVYIVTNRPNGILYTGVTSNLSKRIWEHREGVVPGFTKRYGLKRLVYVERHADIKAAIQREHNMKHWSRTWKVRLILAANPNWADLYAGLL